jgi:hypothetical protein
LLRLVVSGLRQSTAAAKFSGLPTRLTALIGHQASLTHLVSGKELILHDDDQHIDISGSSIDSLNFILSQRPQAFLRSYWIVLLEIAELKDEWV